MTEAEAYTAIKHSNPKMGANFLVDGNTVYEVCLFVMGGVAFERKWTQSDYGWEATYRSAVLNPHTLFLTQEMNG